MDLTAIDTYLDGLRRANDVTMRPCRLVTEAFLPLPAHKVGVAHLFLRPRFILADPTGCGKTPQAVVGYGYLKEKQPGIKLLVVTGKSSQFQWRDSILRFLEGVNAAVLGYTGNKTKLSRADRYASYTGVLQHVDVWITTYALLAKDEERILPVLDNYVLAFDEVHNINNRKQEKLYPAALRASLKARACWGLSTTPMDNGKLDEVYSLFELVRPGTFPPYPTFRKTYYLLKLVKPRWKDKKTGKQARPFYEVTGTQNLDHLSVHIDKFYLRRHEDQIKPGLPPITFQLDDVFLEKPQRDIYDDIIKHRWPQSKTKIDQLAALTYAQQALDAPALLGFPHVGNAKADRLVERLQGDLAGQKVLVYAKYMEVIRLLEARLTAEKILYSRVTGEDSVKARDVARARFSTDPRMNVMLLTDAGGESLDLQAASTVVYYDLPWSPGAFRQIVGRARRIGSRHANVLAILLVATPTTIDEQIAEQLISKERTIRTVFQQGNDQHSLADQLQRTDNSTVEDHSSFVEFLFQKGGTCVPPSF